MRKILTLTLFMVLTTTLSFALGGGGGIHRQGNNAAFIAYTSTARLTAADFAAYTSSFNPGIYTKTSFVPLSSVILSTVIIPFDATEPLIGEGVEVRRINYQPLSENSILEIEYHSTVAPVTSSSLAECALFAPFINTTSIEAVYVRGANASNSEDIMWLYHEYDNSNTDEKLFTVRCGANAGNLYIGAPLTGVDIFGSASNGGLKIREVLK